MTNDFWGDFALLVQGGIDALGLFDHIGKLI